MLKKILLAGIAVSALALNAPVAMADEPTGNCGFESLQQEDATGQNYEGVAYGYAVHADGGTVTVRCYVTVNGTEQSSTVPGTGTGVATTQGRVTFAAGDDDNVQLCTAITAHGVTKTECGDSTSSQIPPQEVIDAIDSVFDIIADATAPLDSIVCGLIKTAGLIPVVNSATAVTTLYIAPTDCDIFLGGDVLIDFFPYAP